MLEISKKISRGGGEEKLMNFNAVEPDAQFLTQQQGYQLPPHLYFLCETCYQIYYVTLLCWCGAIQLSFSVPLPGDKQKQNVERSELKWML